MSGPNDEDDRVGYGRPPKKTRWRKGQSGNPRRKYAPRDHNEAAMIDRLLLAPVAFNVGGQPSMTPALEVIVSQLWAKEMAGDRRALRTRLRYEQFANRNSKPSVEVVFVESDYTTAFSNGSKAENLDD